jgi:hypothetical protein
LTARDVHRARQSALFVLVGLADVEYPVVIQAGGDLVGIDLANIGLGGVQ